MRKHLLPALVCIAVTVMYAATPPVRGQSTRVDFARDVQPLLKQHCTDCHSGDQPRGSYRLDRRSGALGGPTRPNIIPRSSDSSRLYRRLLDSQFGAQMPPKGPLSRDEIEIVRRWIDEGADWPDALANESALPPPNQTAVRASEQFRQSRPDAALQLLLREPSAINGRGADGSTPLMHAALYADTRTVGALLDRGADPNLRSHGGGTALMWAVGRIETVRLLLDRGADVNVITPFGRSALSIASQMAPEDVVSLLLARGATPDQAALTAAANRGRPAVIRLLVATGLRDTGAAAAASRRGGCDECASALSGANAAGPAAPSLIELLPPSNPADSARIASAIAQGANVNVRDAKSRTVAMLAAISETTSPDVMRLLIDKGVDINAVDPQGYTALDYARRLGDTPVVAVLTAAGAAARDRPAPRPAVVRNNTPRDAVTRSLPLLQRTSVLFYERSGCVSCHHNSLTAMTVSAARAAGFKVDEALASRELETAARDIENTREQALQGIFTPGGAITTLGYSLLGLNAERHAADAATDAMVRLIAGTQLDDGRWRSAYRPPTEASLFTTAAVAMRAIQLYGRSDAARENDRAIRAAAAWLERTRPVTTEDYVFRLFGLTWAKAPSQSREAARRALLALQRPDGGWAQLTTLTSDAYATGTALVALHEAGMRSTDPAYRRGVQFLLRTQADDGSWFVRSRSHATQIYQESGFPYGTDQFISTAATNWASVALIHASRKD